MKSILAIIRKDISRFFSELTTVTSLIIFYAILGMLLWIIPNYGFLDGYYANMDLFFTYIPLLLVFLIPALNMEALSGELADGTLDLLLIRPLTSLQILLAKFLSGMLIVLIALIPTILYAISLYYLTIPVGDLDLGGIAGSYIGLFFLVLVYTAISLFASSLVPVPMTALLLAIFLCASWYWAFYLLSRLPVFYGKWDYWIQYLGLDFHYEEMGKGLIPLASIVYILSLACLFCFFTWWKIEKMRTE